MNVKNANKFFINIYLYTKKLVYKVYIFDDSATFFARLSFCFATNN